MKVRNENIDKFVQAVEDHYWEVDKKGNICCKNCGISTIEFDVLKSRRDLFILTCKHIQQEKEYEKYKEKLIKGEL